MENFLIRESAFAAAPVVAAKNRDTIKFVAVMQEANVPNRNGRIYRKEVLEQALQSPYVQERLRTRSFYVEAGHPTDTSVQRQMTIDQRNICAIVEEFWWEGNLLKAKLETANTAVGRDMKGLIEQGSKVAFSLRAQGNVHHDARLGATIVEAPIQIATYDWVVNPSHDKAFLESICEATMVSLFRGKHQTALMESAKLYEEGSIMPLKEVAGITPTVDYAKNFWKKVKPVEEAYVYNPDDKMVVEGKFAILTNGTETKKVVLEDYLLKDLRYKLANLGEAEMPPMEQREFGIPEEKKYPLYDKKHVESAIKLFGFVQPKHEEQLAKAIIRQAEKLGVDLSMVGEDNRLHKYLPKKALAEEVLFEEQTDAEIDALMESISPESIHDEFIALSEGANTKFEVEEMAKKVAGKHSVGWRTFWGWFFLGLPGALLFYFLTKKHNKEVEGSSRYKAIMELTQNDPELKKIGDTMKAELSVAKPDKKAIKELRNRFFSRVKEINKEKTGELKSRKMGLALAEELGDAAAQPVALSDAEPKEHTPEVKKDEVHAGEQAAEEVKPVVVEAEQLGDAAAQPVATSEVKPVEHTPEVTKDEVHAGEQAAEEVKPIVVQEAKGLKSWMAKVKAERAKMGVTSPEIKIDEKKVVKEEVATKLPDVSGMTYKEKFEAMLKHFGFKSIKDMNEEQKKEFFTALNKSHVSKEEKATSMPTVEVKENKAKQNEEEEE